MQPSIFFNITLKHLNKVKLYMYTEFVYVYISRRLQLRDLHVSRYEWTSGLNNIFLLFNFLELNEKKLRAVFCTTHLIIYLY